MPRQFDDGDEKDPVVSRELHGFNDASKKFNHYVIYSGDVQATLLKSKSCIAPLKKITLPRIELLGNFFSLMYNQRCKNWPRKSNLSFRK